MEEKLKQIFKFFDINNEEINGFLVNDIGVNSLDELKINSKAIEKLADFFKINKDFIYGNSKNLLIEKDGFYKRGEKFCEEILNKNVSTLYIISEKTPNKEIDEEDDGNYFYLVAEYNKKLFNNKEIKVFEVFNTNGCRWGYWRCRWEIKKFLLCLKKNHSINKVMGIIDENIVNDYSKFLKGEIKFEKILGNLNIWYPEDYIEFKYENVNAKEEDELGEIIKEIEKIKISNEKFELIYKFRRYLIDVYGYSENEIKIGYELRNYTYDLVILKNNKPYLFFEIKKEFKELHENLIISRPNVNIIVAPFKNEWIFHIVNQKKFFPKKINISKVIENILQILYSDGKRTINETFRNFYDLIRGKKIELSFAEKNILSRLQKLVLPWNKEKFKIFYKLIAKLNLQFDNYIDYRLLKFLKQIYYSVDIKYPFKLVFRDFGININEMSKEIICLYDDNCNFKKNGIYFVPLEFLYMEKYKEQRKNILPRIKLILEFEEIIITNKNNTPYVLIYLTDNRKSCVIEKTNLDNLAKYIDYILHNKLKNFEEISKKDIYINRLDSFYNRKEFIFLSKLLQRNSAKKITNLIDKNKIAFGKGKVGYGENKLIVKDSIKNNKIVKFYSIEKKLYNILPKLKENYLIIASVTENPIYVLISKNYENYVIGSSLIGIYDEKGKIVYDFFETILGKIFLYRIINKHLQISKINLDNLYQLLILEQISPKTIEEINEKFTKKFNKSLEDFLNEISGLHFSNEWKNELEESKILKGVFNKKFDSISTFNTKILLKDLYENNTDIKKLKTEENKSNDFQRNIDNNHSNEIVNYLKKSEFTYIGNIIFGFTEDMRKQLNISLYENELIIPENSYKKFLNNLIIIDGQHRLKALLELEKFNEYINIEIVFTSKDGMAVIFYILNAKGKSFLPRDFFNLFKYEEEAFEELNKLESYMPTIYLKIIKYIKKLKKASIKEIDIKEVFICLAIYWAKFIDKIDIKFKIEFVKLMRIFIRFYSTYVRKDKWINDSTKLCAIFKIIIYDFYKRKEDKICYFEKEINNFFEWIKLNDMYSFLETIDDYSELYETYKKTYIPKSRKIYLSMPYHIHEDLIYFVVKDVVREVKKKIQENIELIRTDKRKLGIHKQIENKIYEEIEESDLLIADITGNNPNVFAEVGYKIALDKAKGLKEPQIIFIKNTRGYYERSYYKEKRGHKVDEFIVNEHIRRNKVTTVAFNFNHIDQIEFSDVEYLKRELENMLLKYYNYYQIKKV